MAKNSKYTNNTQSLNVENYSFINHIHLPSKPVADADLTFISDLAESNTQDLIRSLIPSGWLDVDYTRGPDNSGMTYGINTTTAPNLFYVNSQKETPSIAIVNGWRVDVGGSNINDDTLLQITLPTPPGVSAREDLVFLEVWKRRIAPNSSTGKPSNTTIYKYGNTQYGGTNLTDQMINSTINFETTNRVQLQYRIRVVPGVNFSDYPYGIDDLDNVFSQGGANAPTTGYTFINGGDLFDDYGLYVAGDGTDTAAGLLNTVDGYVYAIPMFKVHRRNTAAYSNQNQNGANYSLLDNLDSDRPDWLYNDQISDGDIEDLRHKVSLTGFDYQLLLDQNFENVLTGNCHNCLTDSELDSSTVFSASGLYINSISSTNQPGIIQILAPNGQQRYYSDVAGDSLVHEVRTVNDKTAGIQGGNWLSSNQIQIDINTPSPSGTIIKNSTPTVVANISNVVTPISGTWTNLGTSIATFTLDPNATLTNQNLQVTYTVSYPHLGYRFTKPIFDCGKVEEQPNGYDWGWVSVNDADNKRFNKNYRRIINGYSDFEYDYKLGTENGVASVVSYFMAGNGFLTYTIPGYVEGASDKAVLYIYKVLANGTPITPTSVTRNAITNDITVSLPTVYSYSDTIRFDLARFGYILMFDERTMSISDMGGLNFYEKSVTGLQDVVFEADDIVIGKQVFNTGVSTLDKCYVNNVLLDCTYTITPNSNLVNVHFSSAVTGTVRVALLTKRTLTSSETLNVYYKYWEYKGITKKNNFDSSSVSSKVLYHSPDLIVTDNGTGAVNTDEHLAKGYEPLIPKLPMIDSAYEGYFTGTIYKSKVISGGGYSNSSWTSPYRAGYANYFIKSGTQTKGSNVGGRFTTSVENSDGTINKVIVGSLIEVVTQDTSKNFVKGELGLKIETNYLNNTTTNKITNSDSLDNTNSYDMFKLIGKPLIKIKKV